ncbi:MAG TPA: HAMP domain-containing sensor histidine kinase [Parachlamydiaceae bacterium]|nr:HAMP domain-containing histidine kinase [Nitrosopumilus sp.]HEV8052886.1 HAMP domain-containing sensor histidine kinase [Parachlamydiaceae bacterium]
MFINNRESDFRKQKTTVGILPEKNLNNNVDLKQITENLYKQNLELAVKNKTLSVLRQLYQISILGLEPELLSNEITKTIQSALDFQHVGLYCFISETNELHPLGFSSSDRVNKTCIDNSIHLDEPILNANNNLFFKPILNLQILNSTSRLEDVWLNLIDNQSFNDSAHIKAVVGYPLVIEQKVVAILIIALNRPYLNLNNFEKESLSSFINIIAIALNTSFLYQKLKITNDKLKVANQGQASLMHFMNHQIKGRLGTSKNIFAELLTDDYGAIPEDAKVIIRQGLIETDRGVNYVQGILKGMSAENGVLPFDMTQINLESIITSIIDDKRANAEIKGLELKLKIQSGDYSCLGDKIQLSEAISNLIDNSINYTTTGSIEVNLESNENKIMISIKDTGIGLSEDDKTRLFKAGGRGKDSIKINTNSTGYGLVFVKGVIEAHGGRVWAESEGTDKGAQFYIEFPIKPTANIR